MSVVIETPTVTYREDRWWVILEAIGACLRAAPWTRWPDEITVQVGRSPVVEDYWPVSIMVEASLHTVVTRGRLFGDGDASVTVHEVHS